MTYLELSNVFRFLHVWIDKQEIIDAKFSINSFLLTFELHMSTGIERCTIIANERNKKKCQKFTPLNKVDDMLDLAGYSRDLFGKKVLEYSFGSGNIIKQIVKRYVEDALTQNIDVNNISSGLSADIYGIELDPQLYDQCISDLNEIVRSYGISPFYKF